MTASPFDPTTEQKRAYLESQLTQYKAAHYQHELNLELAQEIGDQTAIEYNTKCLIELDVAIAFTEKKLAELPPTL
jgi:hypothetical protein